MDGQIDAVLLADPLEWRQSPQFPLWGPVKQQVHTAQAKGDAMFRLDTQTNDSDWGQFYTATL